MSEKYNEKNIVLAKNLRKSATAQEKHLWYDFLSKLIPRFQRQKAIGNYIADFYCHKAKLVVELDGSQHYTEQGLSDDKKRTEYLNEIGLSVLRFSNRDIDDNFKNVCFEIERILRERME